MNNLSSWKFLASFLSQKIVYTKNSLLHTKRCWASKKSHIGGKVAVFILLKTEHLNGESYNM